MLNEALSPEDPMSELAKVDPRELDYYREQQATDNLSDWRDEDGLAQEEEATERMLGESWQYRGWPGDGSGEDDFQDFNQMEADDYSNDY